MLHLIKNVRVFSPQDEGIFDVLIADKKISCIKREIKEYPDFIEVYDGQGKWLTPGFVDGLTHIVGGGGEGGFENRTPEISAEEMLACGVTSSVGALGTDSITRTMENLLGKSRELTGKGVSTYFYSGSYHYPPETLTESIEKDLMYIPEIIGVGELALSDHRGSVLRFDDLFAIARKVRTFASLAGKKGVVFCHLGDEKEELDLLSRVIDETELPANLFVPTHMNRNPELFKTGIQYALKGGYVDYTTSTNQGLLEDGEVACAKALAIALQEGVSIDKISFSSDANASLPRFNAQGEVIGVDCGSISSLYACVQQAVKEEGVSFSQAIQCVTSNPADALGLTSKGRIKVGYDADMVLIDPSNLSIQQVWAKGLARL